MPPSTTAYRNWVLGTMLVFFGALTACENTVDPFVSPSDESFAIYGYLDSEADTQFVRVLPIIDQSGFGYTDSLDARAMLLNVSTGERTPMLDSSIAIGGGRRSYIYFTDETPSIGDAYRLEVIHPGADTIQAFTQMPGPGQVLIDDPETDFQGFLEQRVRWEGVYSVRDIVVQYVVRTGAGETAVGISYRAPGPREERQTRLRLERDRSNVLNALPSETDTSSVALLGIRISAELLSPEWQDASGVQRVFFASVARVNRQWSLADTTVERIGYRLP